MSNKVKTNFFRHDQLVLKKFVAEAYAKLVDVDVKRLDIPERAFTGNDFKRQVFLDSQIIHLSLVSIVGLQHIRDA